MKNHNILICPLEWGLGHAARMIPLAKELVERGDNVFIGSGEEHLSLFRTEMQGLTYINFPGFRPGYSKYFPSWLVMFCKIPALIYHLIREHSKLKKIIRDYALDIVISDNRFGLWNKDVTTVYVTHQLRIPFPKPFRFAEIVGIMFQRLIIRKYNFCFIPDLPGELNVSGRLSHGVKLPANARFIGLLSRFSVTPELADSLSGFHHNTVILSGPEPQRSILKKKLEEFLRKQKTPSIFLGGRPDKPGEMTRTENIIYYNHLGSEQMRETLITSDCIISRSGYSTIMELISLGCTALLIPTPGQTEQEYLAAYLDNKGWFSTISQKNIGTAVLASPKSKFNGKEIMEQSRILFKKEVTAISEYKQ